MLLISLVILQTISPGSTKDKKNKKDKKDPLEKEEKTTKTEKTEKTEKAEKKETTEKKEKKEKKERSIWTIPTEKLWGQPCKTHILPLFHNPSKTLLHIPSTPLKGNNISKLKEMNGWK